MRRTRSVFGVALLLALVHAAWGAPVDVRCKADGGVAICTEPTIVADPANAPVDSDMWTYNVCDMAGTFLWRDAAWATARGGKPIFDPDVVPVSSAFERIVHNACQLGVTDSGWGYTIPSNILCWTGGTLAKNQRPYREFRKLDFNGLSVTSSGCNAPWTETVYAIRARQIACPETYGTRTKANGDLECWKLPPDCPKPTNVVGNPITLLDGCKVQRELDYRSRTPGGVEMERFYNSGGYFRFDAVAKQASDVWRTTWDRRIVSPPTPGSVLAYAQRADGSILAFGADGREMQNNQGAGSALLQKLTNAAGSTSGWRLTTGETDIETYDASGRLTAVALRSGKGYALTYVSGRLGSVTDTFGGSIAFTYDGSGRLSGFIAPGNRTYSYGYDAKGRLTSVTHPDNAVRTYRYEDANFVHALTGISDENGARYATWAYDATGRATLSQHAGSVDSVTLYYGNYSSTSNEGQTIVVDGFGTTRTYYYQVVGGIARIRVVSEPAGTSVSTFDANGNTASVRDANGVQTNYTYDLTRNLETSRTEAYGTALARTVTTQWHAVFRLPVKVVAPSGVAGIAETTDFLYDAQGNLLQKTVSAGNKSRQWTMTYTPLGQLLTVDGPRTDVPDVVSHTYYGVGDPCVGCRGNLRTTTNALGHVTTFDAYDEDGQPTRVIDANGVVTTMTYDVRGRLKTRTANAGSLAETTSFDYDAVGQVVKVTMPDGGALSYQYDAAHRLTEISDSLGNVTQYTLDAMGNRIKEDTFDPADQLQRTHRRVFDSDNRLHNDIGANGLKSTFEYDGNGNLKTSTDAMGRSSAMSYDPLNRMTALTDAAGGIVRYGYDAKDRLALVKDPIGLTTSYTYDAVGNLIQLSSPDTGITTYVPDTGGNTVASTDARGLSTTYLHDALNRQTLATFADGDVAMEYDNVAVGGAFAKGRLTKVADPSGSTAYLYDPLGRVLRKTQLVGSGPSAKTFTVSYDYGAGRMTGMTLPSGRKLTFGFDAQGRIAAISLAGQTVVSGVTYAPFGPVQGWKWANGQVYRRTYDLDGRVATLATGPESTAFGAGSWAFGYDSVNRLVGATLPAGEALSYTYDANGNRKQETRAGAVTSYGYHSASNRLQVLTGALAKSFSYDAAGNLTGNGGVTFTYDGRGRMTQVSNGYRYAINGIGQRVSKIGPAETTYFVYDERGHVIGEYDATGGVRQELAWISDTPVASLRPAPSGVVDIYPIYTDHLNTPRLITDMANRTVWEWPLDTFGAVAAKENPSGLGTFSFNLRFPGQYYDAETGLHYNYFRDYDPKVGRYVESDPIGLSGGINSYVYVGNEPLRFTDRDGLVRWPQPPKPRPGTFCGAGFLEPFIPDVSYWPRFYSFTRACQIHDKCYATCGQPKEGCDNDFFYDMVAECEKLGGGYATWRCKESAHDYYLAVNWFGGSAYREGQRTCRDYCVAGR